MKQLSFWKRILHMCEDNYHEINNRKEYTEKSVSDGEEDFGT
jgi:hypothetical protein